MAQVETLQAMLERRLIRDMTLAIAAATADERERQRAVLADLIEQADATLDPERFDASTRARLERLGLWVWSRRPAAPRRRHEPRI